VQLSAGLDSASVTASAARLLGAQGKHLTAFTGVPRPQFNNITEPWQLASEGTAASEVARLYPNIEHVLVDSTGYDLLQTMKAWTDAMDEPALNIVNLLWISAILGQAKQRDIGVMLEGASGNGTISWETWAILGHLFRRGRWIKLLNTTRSLRNHGDISLRAAARSSLGGLLPDWCNRKLLPADKERNSYFPLASPELILNYALDRRMDENMYTDVRDLDDEHAQLFETFDFGPIHAATQAIAQIDVRDPTADKRIYDFCFSIPREQYIVGGHSRSLVRRAMRDRLPESTLLRYTRGHQGADWYLPMAEALPSLRAETALIEQSPTAQRTIDLPRLRGLLDTWPDSGYHTNRVNLLWHDALTRGISMGYFLRSHDSGDPPPPAPPAQESPAVPVPPVVAPLN
jgi:asparagine synthase (glutamine-hydrolysing)